MNIFASLSKATKDGGSVTWNFCEIHGKFFALRENNKVIPCKDKNALRSLYAKYKNDYGFTPVIAWSPYPANAGFFLQCSFTILTMNIDTLYQKYAAAAATHLDYPIDFNDFITAIDHICDYPDDCESWMINLFTPDEIDFIMDNLSEEWPLYPRGSFLSWQCTDDIRI